MSNDGYNQGRHPHEGEFPSKRRRIAFSCLDCRRRKLKCDRVYPCCTRCQKSKNLEDCVYDTNAVELGLRQNSRARNEGTQVLFTPTSRTSNGISDPDILPSTPTVPKRGIQKAFEPTQFNDLVPRLQAQDERIRQLEDRIKGLEDANAAHSQGHSATIGHVCSRSKVPIGIDEPIKEAMNFRGKSFKTQFYGATDHSSYLPHIPELRSFMKSMVIQHPGLKSRIHRDLKALKFRGDDVGKDHVDDHILATLVPEREVMDRLLRHYIDTVEVIYHVLHLPTFLAEYDDFYKAPNSRRPAFAALLLLIFATVNCAGDKDPSLSRGESSIKRETATMWIRKCDVWLQRQSQKHTTLVCFQLHCVSFIAKQVNSIKTKRTWTNAGTLMRMAMSAGLHRNTDFINLGKEKTGKVSAFDREMRRRIWATIAELEFQASMERGMPAMTGDFEDCGNPANLDDENFGPSEEQPPDSKPATESTRSTYQHISHTTLPLRLNVLSFINTPSSKIQYEDVLKYDQEIMRHLDNIPQWSNQDALLTTALLQLQLQQLLVVLHRPYLVLDSGTYGSNYSAIIYLRSAKTIIDLHHRLAGRFDGQSTTWSNVFQYLFRNDIFGAAISICHSVSFSDPDAGTFSPPYHYVGTHLSDSFADRQIMPSRSSVLRLSGDPLPYLEKALQLLEAKINALGIGLPDYWCVAAITGLVEKETSPQEKRDVERIASDRVFRVVQRLLSLQDNYSAAATLASLPNVPANDPCGLNTVMNGSEVESHAPTEANGLIEGFDGNLGEFDLSDLAGWDLDTLFDM